LRLEHCVQANTIFLFIFAFLASFYSFKCSTVKRTCQCLSTGVTSGSASNATLFVKLAPICAYPAGERYQSICHDALMQPKFLDKSIRPNKPATLFFPIRSAVPITFAPYRHIFPD